MGPFAFLQANGKEGSMTRALRAACVIVGLIWAQSAVADPSMAAANATRKAVKEFVRTVFKPE